LPPWPASHFSRADREASGRDHADCSTLRLTKSWKVLSCVSSERFLHKFSCSSWRWLAPSARRRLLAASIATAIPVRPASTTSARLAPVLHKSAASAARAYRRCAAIALVTRVRAAPTDSASTSRASA
jgi:hypothetical protein